MSKTTRVARYGVLGAALLLTGYNGIVEGLNAIHVADTPGMKLATATQLLYGVAAIASCLAMGFRRPWVFRILVVWGLAVTATGALAPVVYAGRSLAVGVAVGAVTGLVVALLLWAWPGERLGASPHRLACAAALGAFLHVGCGRSESPADGRMATTRELRDSLGLTAENRPVIRLDSATVPVELRSLIGLAEKWGIGDDVIRSDYIAKASQAEREELRRAVSQQAARITTWLDSFGSAPMTEAAAAFMYMQLAVEELPRP